MTPSKQNIIRYRVTFSRLPLSFPQNIILLQVLIITTTTTTTTVIFLLHYNLFT